MSYPFWLKNQANRASADAWQSRSDANKVKIEKDEYQKTTIKFISEIESLLKNFEDESDIKDLTTKLKKSIKEFKESTEKTKL